MRRAAASEWMAGFRTASADEVLGAAEACWDEPEHEFQDAGADLMKRHADRFGPTTFLRCAD